LIEAMVSVLVLSVGLLGVAALLAVSLRATSSAGYRSQAAWLATQMVEEARANRAAFFPPSGAVVGSGSPSCATAPGGTPLSRWLSRVACALPSGSGSVAYTNFGASGQHLVVTVTWDDSRAPEGMTTGGSSAATFTLESAL
jgi:type IV pilus assembly protein PilV